MNKIKGLTMDGLELIIERKILEILGDTDLGLELKEDFKSKLKERLENPSVKMSHTEVKKRFG